MNPKLSERLSWTALQITAQLSDRHLNRKAWNELSFEERIKAREDIVRISLDEIEKEFGQDAPNIRQSLEQQISQIITDSSPSPEAFSSYIQVLFRTEEVLVQGLIDDLGESKSTAPELSQMGWVRLFPQLGMDLRIQIRNRFMDEITKAP